MAFIVIDQFSGLIQKTEATKLSPNYATHCVNCLFETGTISSMRGFSTLAVPLVGNYTGSDNFIFKYNGTLGALPKGSSFAESPVVNDYRKRYFFTRPNETPRAGDKNSSGLGFTHELGVPYPTEPPSVTAVQRTFFTTVKIDAGQGRVIMEVGEPHRLTEGQRIITGDTDVLYGRKTGTDNTNKIFGFRPIITSIVSDTSIELVSATRDFRVWRELLRPNGGFHSAYVRIAPIATATSLRITDLTQLNAFHDRTLVQLRQSGVFDISPAFQSAYAAFEDMRFRLNTNYDWFPSANVDVSGVDRTPITALHSIITQLYADMGGNTVFVGSAVTTQTNLNTVVFAVEIDRKTISHVYTYVNKWGDESAPSLPSTSIDVFSGQVIKVTTKPIIPGDWNWDGRIRIYRSASGTSTAEFLFVKEVVNTTGFLLLTDYEFNSDEFLAEAIETIGWHLPPQGVIPSRDQDYPTGPMQGIINTPAGFLAGYTGRTLCFSVPYAPYAWPVIYQDAVPHQIKKLIAFEGGILVLTDGDPYLLFGTDPKSLILRRINRHQPCLNAASVVDMGSYVLYAGPDGLVGIENGSASIVTAALFSREQWQALNPASIRAVYVNEVYHGLGNNDDGCYAFVLDIRTSEPVFTFVDYGCPVLGYTAHYDPETDQSVIINTNYVAELFEGGLLAFKWRSKVFDIDAPRNYGYLQVRGSGYPFTVKIYTNGVESYSVNVTSPDPVRLPSGNIFREWQLEISGTGNVRQIAIAQHSTELP